MKEISLDEFRSTVLKVVQEKGFDYVYFQPEGPGTPCVYLDKEQNPSCLLGHALMDIGVLPAELSRLAMNSSSIGKLDTLGVIHLSAEALWWASALQSAQDKKTRWGKAVEIADAAARSRGYLVNSQ